MKLKEFFKFTWLKLVIFLLLLIVIPLVAAMGVWGSCPLAVPNLGGVERPVNHSCDVYGTFIKVLWPMNS